MQVGDTSARAQETTWEECKIILLSGMNFITSSQCMCTHPTEQTNETHTDKKAFTLFTCHLIDVFICVSALQKPSFNILSKLFYMCTQFKHFMIIVPQIIRHHSVHRLKF